MGFLDYDVEIRKIICSPNAIESLDAHYRRAVRARGHFPTEQAALKCLYLVTRSLDRPDAARHAGSPAASMTTAAICARLSPHQPQEGPSPQSLLSHHQPPNRLGTVTHHPKPKRHPSRGTRQSPCQPTRQPAGTARSGHGERAGTGRGGPDLRRWRLPPGGARGTGPAGRELLDHGTYGFMDLAGAGRQQAAAAFNVR